MKIVLILDLDNTLYNWVDYFGKSFRGMSQALSRELQISEEEFCDEAKKIFQKTGTLEYAFLIQELPFVSQLPDKEIHRLINLSQKVFSIVRARNLKPYNNVKSTLKHLHSTGVIIIAVTNAPIYYGESRLRQLSLDQYFYGILGWEGNEVPEDKFTERIRKNIELSKYQSKNIVARWSETIENIKPNPIGYLKVLDHLKASHKNTFIVGDSLKKDILPANQIGAFSIWARYGTKFEEKNFKTLLEITHWDDQKVADEYSKTKIVPNLVIDDFSELVNVVKGPQLNLFE